MEHRQMRRTVTQVSPIRRILKKAPGGFAAVLDASLGLQPGQRRRKRRKSSRRRRRRRRRRVEKLAAVQTSAVPTQEAAAWSLKHDPRVPTNTSKTPKIQDNNFTFAAPAPGHSKTPAPVKSTQLPTVRAHADGATRCCRLGADKFIRTFSDSPRTLGGDRGWLCLRGHTGSRVRRSSVLFPARIVPRSLARCWRSNHHIPPPRP
ncbi:unnamed protein product [Pleuronectes platessa]|uniref:Uncharacterized protein n=1 Tax=Pleuronectes platessa TaxID=8262 RepID=A0A9N7ZE68_PLEPL|nr:unnamed protein product [Pleuronectes platessa]